MDRRKILSNIRVVLVEPTHPGNIGAAARAMKTMGLEQLYLVNPRTFPSQEASDRAVSAVDVLDRAVVTRDLQSAIAECKLVVGASARNREFPVPILDAREAGLRIAAEAAGDDRVAMLFGPEQDGLSNESLDACAYQLRIPTNPDFSSLNLAAALQLVCYEIFVAASSDALAPAEVDLSVYPSHEEVEYFYEQLGKVLAERDFAGPINPDRVNAKLRRMLTRARPKGNELQLLHGLLRLMRDESKDEH